MDHSSATLSVLAGAVKQIDDKHQQIHLLQARLRREMQALPQDSRAAHELRQHYARFDAEYQNVQQGLERLHGALAGTLRNRSPHRDRSIIVSGRGSR